MLDSDTFAKGTAAGVTPGVKVILVCGVTLWLEPAGSVPLTGVGGSPSPVLKNTLQQAPGE